MPVNGVGAGRGAGAHFNTNRSLAAHQAPRARVDARGDARGGDGRVAKPSSRESRQERSRLHEAIRRTAEERRQLEAKENRLDAQIRTRLGISVTGVAASVDAGRDELRAEAGKADERAATEGEQGDNGPSSDPVTAEELAEAKSLIAFLDARAAARDARRQELIQEYLQLRSGQ